MKNRLKKHLPNAITCANLFSGCIGIVLAFNGTPTSYKGKDTVIGLQGDTVHVSRGPAAAMIAIKQIGTNGGGWFGVNSAHPFENPNYLTNMVENISIILISISLVFALGYYLNKKKLAWVIFGVMTIGFLAIVFPSVRAEVGGNPAIAHLGIAQPGGSMEGKEVRFGAAASAYWGITTTVTSNGSVNAMHDSMMPISGLGQMFDMMINSFYGGVGVGYCRRRAGSGLIGVDRQGGIGGIGACRRVGTNEGRDITGQGSGVGRGRREIIGNDVLFRCRRYGFG